MANFRIYNETLCPEIWDSLQRLDRKVRVNLLQMAYDFYGKTKFPAPVVDVYLMGSISNYNWNLDSDIDVHVIIDYSKLQMPMEAAIKAVKTAAQQWNAEHNVMIKGHKVEMNLQSVVEQKPYVTGIYSLVKDQWIRKPFKMPLRIDKNVLKIQYGAMKGYIQNAITSRDREKMKSAKKYLDAYRQYGLDTYGELSYENLIFKILRSRGLIKQLKDGIVSVYDQEMTVKESDYIGSTFSGKAKGSPVANALGTVHGKHDMISGVNSQNWRYLERNNKVLWNTNPSPEDVGEVTQWLLKQGVKNPIHKVMHKEGVTEVEGEEYKSFQTTKLTEELFDHVPDANVPYLIIGVTNSNGESASGVTLGGGGHGSLSMHTDFDFTDTISWRYKSKSNIMYMDVRSAPWWKTVLSSLRDYLKEKYNLDHVSVSIDVDKYIGRGHSIHEVGERDVKQTLPAIDPKYDRDYWGKYDREKDVFRLDRLTMDELKALREKAFRMANGYISRGKSQWATLLKKDYVKYDAELKRRLQAINKPLSESPLMTKKGATALAGDKPLKGQNVEEVYGNIVVIRQGTEGGFLAVGWTMVFFMDSDESAQAMKKGEIPYLMVPRGTFMHGGSPITDIWLKKFQKPGTEHILGVIEGHSDEKSIFIDMITVRPGWKRNHIAKLMMDRLKKTFPEAKWTTSKQTDAGQKLSKSYGGEQEKTDEDKTSNVHFTLSPPDKNNVVGINFDGKRFAQSYIAPSSWGKHGGKWVFNKGGMAIDMKHPGFDKGYDKPEDILVDLEKWYKTRRIQNEGYGSGIPEKDRLKIKNTDGSTRRWQVRSKDAPKTPKMTAEIVKAIPESDFEEGQPLPPMK